MVRKFVAGQPHRPRRRRWPTSPRSATIMVRHLRRHRGGLRAVPGAGRRRPVGHPAPNDPAQRDRGARTGHRHDPHGLRRPDEGQRGLPGHRSCAARPTSAPAAPNVAAHCSAPVSSGVNVRGSARTCPAAIRSAPPAARSPILAGSRTTPCVWHAACNQAGALGDKAWAGLPDGRPALSRRPCRPRR